MKKFVALLLAVLMVALPVLGLAEDTSLVEEAIAAGRKATTTVRLNQFFNDEEMVDKEEAELVQTLINALTLVITEQKDGGSLALIAASPAAEGAEPVTGEISFAYGPMETGDSYLTSSLLGNQKLVVSENEILPMAKKLVNAAELMQLLDAETAAQLQAQIDATDLEDVKKQLDSAFAEIDLFGTNDVDVLKSLAETWKDSITVEPVEGQPKNCDHAVSVITVNMSPEMLKDYYKFFMQKMDFLPDEAVNAVLEEIANVSYSARVFIDSQDEVVYETVTSEMPETVYVDKDGKQVDAQTVELLKQYLTEEEMADRYEEVQVKTTTELELTRLTRDHDVAYSLNMEVKQDDKTIGTMTGSLVTEDNGHALAKVDMIVSAVNPEDGAVGFSVTVDVQTAQTETTEDTAVKVDVVLTDGTAESKQMVNINALCNVNNVKNGVDVTGNASFVMTMDSKLNGEEHHAKLLDITATTVTGEPDAPVADADCIHPAAMTDNDFLTWLQGIMNTVMVNGMTFWQSLPEEVLAGMMM